MAPNTFPLYPGEDRAATARWTEAYRSAHQSPNPPSQRGWNFIGNAKVYLGSAEPGMFEVPDGGLSEIARLRQQESATASLLRALDRAVAESRSLRDVDRTFENETRPL